MNNVNVWLDDEREAPAGWLHFRSARGCIAVLHILLDSSKVSVVEVSLDHDLGPCRLCTGEDECKHNGNGYDVLVWLEERIAGDPACRMPAKISIHSANASVLKKMNMAVESIERLKSCQE